MTEDAHHFRNEAQRCLARARKIGDRVAAEELRLTAEQHSKRADEIHDTEAAGDHPDK
jgi:hypothetical protein